MGRVWRPLAALLACLVVLGCRAAAAQDPAGPPYRIEPSEVTVPNGVEMGEYQRVIRPFGNWTLICDENLAEHERVCNVTQTIEDGNGTMAFSWSLAATEEGDPYMILRTAPNARPDDPISLSFEGRDAPVEVEIDGCNETVCVGMVPVGPILREQIARETSATVSYRTTGGGGIEVATQLEGLSRALDAVE